MRTLFVLLAIAGSAAAHAGPCDAIDTFDARRCQDAVAEARATAEEAREAIAALAGCADTKKKKDLQTCAADLQRAARRLSRASAVLIAATAAAEARATQPAQGDGMARPGVNRADGDADE